MKTIKDLKKSLENPTDSSDEIISGGNNNKWFSLKKNKDGKSIIYGNYSKSYVSKELNRLEGFEYSFIQLEVDDEILLGNITQVQNCLNQRPLVVNSVYDFSNVDCARLYGPADNFVVDCGYWSYFKGNAEYIEVIRRVCEDSDQDREFTKFRIV